MKNTQLTLLKPYTRQLVILLIACVVSVSVLSIGHTRYNDAHSQKEQAITRVNQLNRETSQLEESQVFLDKTGMSFRNIQTQGFYGEEDRLLWGETLKATAQRLKLPKFKYSIRPQQQIGTVGSGFSPSLSLSQSIMDIEADLLHEGDFVSISEQLSKMPGLFRVIDCELIKEKEISLTEPNKNVSLKCSLAWHTVKHVVVDEEMIEDDIDLEFM